MTTEAAENFYLAQYQLEMQGRELAMYNPKNKPIDELPIIYGFNNSGSPGMLSAVLLAEDGTGLGSHACSHEGYMPGDLGILKGTRPDRHKGFRDHYPEGYRMTFVESQNIDRHKGLNKAFGLNKEQAINAR